jgi:hypothetical protein
MIARKFKEFYNPYFFDASLTVTSIKEATVEQARTCHLLASFDHGVVDDLPLLELVEKHILELPNNFTFVTIGPEADPLDKYLRILIPRYRADISFIKPDLDIDPTWVEYSTKKYFSSHPVVVHTIATMDRLISQGIPCGRVGPFIRGKQILNQWRVQCNHGSLSYYLYGLDHQDMVVPNFTLPFARAFIKDLELPNPRIPIKLFGPVVLMNCIMEKVTGAIPLTQHIEDGDDWNWYPNLINRNWPGTRFDYYNLEIFQ